MPAPWEPTNLRRFSPMVTYSALAARWMHLPATARRALRLDRASVSTLGRERKNRVISYWNEACHLRSEDRVL